MTVRLLASAVVAGAGFFAMRGVADPPPPPNQEDVCCQEIGGTSCTSRPSKMGCAASEYQIECPCNPPAYPE